MTSKGDLDTFGPRTDSILIARFPLELARLRIYLSKTKQVRLLAAETPVNEQIQVYNRHL
jgi:hypothetical protein